MSTSRHDRRKRVECEYASEVPFRSALRMRNNLYRDYQLGTHERACKDNVAISDPVRASSDPGLQCLFLSPVSNLSADRSE